MAAASPPNTDFEVTPVRHPIRVFLRFLKFLLPYWDKVLFGFMAIIVATPLAMLQLPFTKAIMDDCLLSNVLSAKERWWLLLEYTIIVGCLLWVARSIEVVQGFMNYFIEFHVTMDLRKLFYKHLHRLPVSFFQNRPIGEHMFRCMVDVSSDGWTRRGLINIVTDTIPNAFKILYGLALQISFVLYLNPSVFWLLLLNTVPNAIVQYMMNTRMKRAMFQARELDQKVPAVLRDSIAGVETLKSYGRSRYMSRLYMRQFIKSLRYYYRFAWLGEGALDRGLGWAVGYLNGGLLWSYLLYQFMVGEISFGTVSVLLTVSGNLLAPFGQIISSWQTIRQQMVPMQRVMETLGVEPALEDLPDAKPMPRVQGAIRFDDVSFAYDPAVPILKNVSFSIESGKTLGIVGRSGAGKTTIINLLLRLHRPDKGKVLIDGHDLDKVRIADWQDQVSIVLQDTYIFGGDVAYNIRYGKPNATEAEVAQALRMADADEFVGRMSNGIHTDLHEGATLSGGQKQRLGIARAMVRKPQVLLLDEPTSSLDSRTENEIWRSFEKAMQGGTAVVISHRLATVRKADKIIVLSQGQVIEEGSHADLLAARGTYYDMWMEQTGQTEEEIETARDFKVSSRGQRFPQPLPAPEAQEEEAAAPALVAAHVATEDPYEQAKAYSVKRGRALDLMCQHELTPDLSAAPKSARGQLKTIRFGLRYLKPVWTLVLLHFVIVLPSALLFNLAPWAQALIINRAQPEQNWEIFFVALVIAWSTRVILSNGILTHPPQFINWAVTWYIAAIVRLRMRRDYYKHLHRLSLRFFERRPIGENMYRAQADIDWMIGMLTTEIPALIEAVFNFAIVMTLAALMIDTEVVLIILLYLPPFYIIYHLLYSVVRRVDRESRMRWQKVDATLQEGVAGIKTVKAYARQRHELRKFMAGHTYAFRVGVAGNWLNHLKILLFGFIFTQGILPWLKSELIKGWTYYKVIFSGIPLGTAQVMAGYAGQITNPLSTIIEKFNAIRLALIPAERMMETMTVEPMVGDKAGAVRAPAIQGALTFDDVRFSYDPGTEVLKGCSFSIRPGETVGIVGPSGAGKSTISKLALRLYDADSGRIQADDWAIDDVVAETYQSQVGTVMQETYLFGGSIRDNILFSRPDATEQEIQKVIDAADLREFVDGLPMGIDTDLAEGTRLSGGQRQRIGIARALIRQPRLMILDEPTASLDSRTEAEVMQTLWKVMKSRTTLIVSHRLALVRQVDRILVVDDGRIVEQGSHDELLAVGGLYAELWTEQYGEAVA